MLQMLQPVYRLRVNAVSAPSEPNTPNDPAATPAQVVATISRALAAITEPRDDSR
jgi:hypothetical protein